MYMQLDNSNVYSLYVCMAMDGWVAGWMGGPTGRSADPAAEIHIFRNLLVFIQLYISMEVSPYVLACEYISIHTCMSGEICMRDNPFAMKRCIVGYRNFVHIWLFAPSRYTFVPLRNPGPITPK